MIVEGLDTKKQYTADEVIAFNRSGKLRSVTLKGWLFRSDMNGGMRMVHWTDPTANRVTPGSPNRGMRNFEIPDPLPQMKVDVNSDSPIRKRTPQERLASLTNKLRMGETGQEAAALMMLRMLSGAGSGIDGLSDEQVKQITGASWKGGDPLDDETVRRVAANYLGEAERQVEVAARDTRTRAGRKARREQERLEAQEKKAWLRRQKALDAAHESTKRYL